jgi:hypothetical protein
MELQNFLQIFPYLIGYFRGLKLKQEKKENRKRKGNSKKKRFQPPDRTGPNPAQPASRPRPHRPARRVVGAAGPSKPTAQPALFFLFFFFSLLPDGWDHMSSLSWVRSFQEICTRTRVSVPIGSNQKRRILLPLFHETSPINSPRPPLSFPHEILAF